MTGNLVHWRVLRPDGTEAARGPIRCDLVAATVRAEGILWHLLEAKGWRVETVGGAR